MARNGTRRLPVALIAALGALFAADAAGNAAAANTTVRLIEILIQNGVLTRDQADALLRQAEAEAAAQRAARPAVVPAPAPAAARPATRPSAPADAVAPAEVPAGTVRVTFVPETVRRQIREEVRRDVMAELRPQGAAAAAAPAAPQWTDRIRPSGDVRLRAEFTHFPSGNAPSSQFPNFQSINNGSAFDLNGTANAPLLNTEEERTRYRLRARLGVQADIDSWISAEFRLATGNDSSPVSTNQTFGAVSSANGQFGSFSKYAVWLDLAYLRMAPVEGLTVNAGRMPNPFVSTDLLYDVDLGFDGIAARYRRQLADGVNGYVTAGAFPYFNTDFNFSSTEVEKFRSRDRYLLGLQAGGDWRFAHDWNIGLNLGYYNFVGAQGSVSSPCAVPSAADACDTDVTRAFFTQNTNTLRPLRNLTPRPATDPRPQYFGLASPFEILDIYARLDYTGFAPYRVTAEGNYVNNIGFDRARLLSRGVFGTGSPNGIINNLGPGNTFAGGSEGYLLRLSLGHADVDSALNWQVSFAYRYLESDAVLDAFTDSDFRLGGTNSKGFIIGGALGIARNTALRLRYMSGEEIAGPAYKADVIQLDLTARF